MAGKLRKAERYSMLRKTRRSFEDHGAALPWQTPWRTSPNPRTPDTPEQSAWKQRMAAKLDLPYCKYCGSISSHNADCPSLK